eukprot:m.478368 g.478368  ORF g.478368 m.478368 type:complete len:151 (-) comp21131_c0_seq1:224-676(-)
MATYTKFDPVSRKALEILKARGELPADFDIDAYEEEPEPEPHWTDEPAKADEKWGTYGLRLTLKGAFLVLKGMDAVGERLAYFFGITTPKYAYILDEVVRSHEEAIAEAEEEEEQMRQAAQVEAAELGAMEAAGDVEDAGDDMAQKKDDC